MLSRLFKGVVEKRLAKELNVTPKEFVEIHLLQESHAVLGQVWAVDDALLAASDGLFDPCRDMRVSTDGLFMSMAPGRDQVLGQDR
eukprot:g15641.t1